MASMVTETVNMHANNPISTESIHSPIRYLLQQTIALFIAFMLSSPAVYAQDLISIDKIIVIVDDDVVLQSEFDMRWNQVTQQIEQQVGTGQVPRPTEAALNQYRSDLLDQLIVENLQMQMASRAGVRVDDNQLNQAMNNIAQQNNMTFEQFRQVLEQQGLYLQTREQLRKDILLQQLQVNAVNGRIDITRQEVENYLRSEAGQQDIAPEYLVAHILIEHAEGAEQARRKELADFLYQQLLEGAELQEFVAARQVSGIPLRGGLLEGWRKQESLPSYFRDVVPTLKLGEISEPFESSSGLHIVQVRDLRGGANREI